MSFITTFVFGGIALAAYAISLIALPFALIEMDREAILGAGFMFLLTVNVYYYFRVAAFILLKFWRRGCAEASFGSVLVDSPFYFKFYSLGFRLTELAAVYGHLLSDEEASAAASLARKHRIAAWVSGGTFVSVVAIAAILGALGIIEPTG